MEHDKDGRTGILVQGEVGQAVDSHYQEGVAEDSHMVQAV